MLLLAPFGRSAATRFYLQQRPPTPSLFGFFSAPFQLVPLSRATHAIFLVRRKPPTCFQKFTRYSESAFFIWDQAKRWSGQSKWVLWNPSCYDLRFLRRGEHSSRESKQKRNTIRTSFLLEAAAVPRFLNQPAVRNYIASALWLAEQNSREFLSQSKETSKPVVICWHELTRAWGRLHASKYDWFTWLWARVVIGQSYYIGFRLRHSTLSVFRWIWRRVICRRSSSFVYPSVLSLKQLFHELVSLGHTLASYWLKWVDKMSVKLWKGLHTFKRKNNR